MTVTLASGTDNSAAAICAISVRTPVPRSTLPEKTEMLPRASTERKPSTWSSATVLSFLGKAFAAAGAFTAASASLAPSAKVTTRAPPPVRNGRRPRRVTVPGMGPSSDLAAGALDGAHDAQVRAAAAEVVGERLLDLVLGRMLVLREQDGGLHDHAVDAVAALRGLLVDEGLLKGVRLFRRAQAFERHHLLSLRLRSRIDAGPDRFAVDVHGAGAALGQAAAEARAVQVEVVAKHVEERRGRVVELHRPRLAVATKSDRRHRFPSRRRSSVGCAKAPYSGVNLPASRTASLGI